MQDKLRDLMKSEGLKSGQLAELLGINPAGISHILAGRNKPSFELLQKILRRFPQLNPDWLLVDRGPMYRTLSDTLDTPGVPDAPCAPGANGANGGAAARNTAPNDTARAADLFAAADGSSGSTQTPPAKAAVPPPSGATATPFPAGGSRRVARVVLCYEDGTFESYAPTPE